MSPCSGACKALQVMPWQMIRWLALHLRSMRARAVATRRSRWLQVLPRILLVVFGMALSAQPKAASGGAAVSSAVASEERVKAAYLYKFLNYVDWPPAAFARTETPYFIGVLNAEDVAGDLDALVVGRTVNNRPVVVKRIGSTDPVIGIHMLFIGKAERSRQATILRQLQSQPVLVVTEGDTPAGHGGMINFRLADDRVRFDVAIDSIEKAGLKLDSRMLAVALSVSKKGSP